MFDNKFTKMGNDSLAEAAKQAMQDGDLRRKAEAHVNESFGVYSRQAVIREKLAAYDAALEEAYKCMKEGKPLDPVGKEDKDIDNDGDHDKSDKYLLNRRKAIGRAIGKKMEEAKKSWEEETDYSAPDRAAVTKDSKPVVSDTASKADTSGPSASDKAGLASKIKAIKESISQQALAEKAPPGAKMERMVKHIKKGYAGDGELTKKEKGIAYATAWKAYGKHKKDLKEGIISLEEANESFAAFVAEAINAFALSEHPEATVENLHMFNEDYVIACLEEAYACSDEKMKKHEKMKKDLEEAAEAFGKEKEEKGEKKHKEDEEEKKEIKEAKYSFKAAREGEDIGKPGKNFKKIAKKVAEKYGSEERGKKVAGAVLAKIRAKHMKESMQIDEVSAFGQAFRAAKGQNFTFGGKTYSGARADGAASKAPPAAPTPGTQGVATGKSFSAIDRAQSAKAKAGPADNPGLRGAPQASSMSTPGTVARDTGITGKPGGETGVTSGSTVSLDRQGNVGASPTAAPSPAPKPTTAPAPSTSTPSGAKPSTSGLVGPEAGKMATPAAAAPAAPVTSQPGAPKDDASAGVKKVMSMNESVQVGDNKYRIV